MQALVLPVVSLLSHLNQDGSYAPSPWLMNQPGDAPSGKAASTSATTAPAVHPQQPSLPAQQVSSASANQLEQSIASQDEAVNDSRQTAFPWQVTAPRAQTLPAPAEVLACSGKDVHTRLCSIAARLMSESQKSEARFHALKWLSLLVPQLSDEGCKLVSDKSTVEACIQLIQQDSETVLVQLAALEFCLELRERGFLPIALLLDVNLHHQLASLVIQSGQRNFLGMKRMGFATLFTTCASCRLPQCLCCASELVSLLFLHPATMLCGF